MSYMYQSSNPTRLRRLRGRQLGLEGRSSAIQDKRQLRAFLRCVLLHTSHLILLTMGLRLLVLPSHQQWTWSCKRFTCACWLCRVCVVTRERSARAQVMGTGQSTADAGRGGADSRGMSPGYERCLMWLFRGCAAGPDPRVVAWCAVWPGRVHACPDSVWFLTEVGDPGPHQRRWWGAAGAGFSLAVLCSMSTLRDSGSCPVEALALPVMSCGKESVW